VSLCPWGGGGLLHPPLPLAGSVNNSCKDDSVLFSRFLHGKTGRQRKDRQIDKRNDRTTKRQKGKGDGRQIEETEKKTNRNTESWTDHKTERKTKRQTDKRGRQWASCYLIRKYPLRITPIGLPLHCTLSA
jgi:hypothetical protein